MRQRRIRLALAFVTVSALALSFQNCSKGFNSAGEGALGSLGSGSTNDATPFAFDVAFDQISYNSCFGTAAAGRPGYVSLTAGAYGKSGTTSLSGVRLTNAFLDYARNSGVLEPTYPATEITDTQIKQFLASSPSNMAARPQMALRLRGAPQFVITPNGDEETEGVNYFTLLGNLTDDRWMHPLVKNNGAFTNFFDLAPGLQRNLEASITYNKDEGLAQGLRDALRSTGMLALTFQRPSDQGQPTSARPVVDPATNQESQTAVFGKGYNLTFESAIAPYTRFYPANTNPVPYSLNPNNILTNVTETNLADPGHSSGTWTCDESRRYLIVRPTDAAANPSPCPRDPYAYMIYGIPGKGISAAIYRQELEVIRRSLKPEYWDVSVEFKCAVPKEGSCYQNEVINGQATAIEYDQTKPCYQSLPDISYGGTLPLKRCAQYVSICTRN